MIRRHGGESEAHGCQEWEHCCSCLGTRGGAAAEGYNASRRHGRFQALQRAAGSLCTRAPRARGDIPVRNTNVTNL